MGLGSELRVDPLDEPEAAHRAEPDDGQEESEGNQPAAEVGHAEAVGSEVHQLDAHEGNKCQENGDGDVEVLLEKQHSEGRDEPVDQEPVQGERVSNPAVEAGEVEDERGGDDVDRHRVLLHELAELLDPSGLHLRSHGLSVRGVGHGGDSPFPCAGIEWHRRLCLQWRLPVRVGSNRWSTYITSSSCCFLPKDRKITGIQL